MNVLKINFQVQKSKFENGDWNLPQFSGLEPVNLIMRLEETRGLNLKNQLDLN